LAKLRTKRAVSAGGVVFRQSDGRLQVLICGRGEPRVWALPKGTPLPNEDLARTAQREVKEETGIEARILGEAGTIQYWFVEQPERVRVFKQVKYFLMEPVGGDIGQHDWEFDEVAWVDLEEALRRLTYPNERELVRRAAELYLKGQTDGSRP